jgi:colicin import membrane protein
MKMNKDPIGTQGRSSGSTDIDLAVLGGAEFAARITALGNANGEAAEALKQLRLGNDVVAARDEAQANLRAAQQAKADAEKMRKEAADYAATTRAAADDYASVTRAAAEAAQAAAEQAKRDTAAARSKAIKALAAAKQTEAEWVEKKRRLDGKIEKLKTALAAEMPAPAA